LEEVTAYCLERRNAVDAEQFIAHYESNGWKVGRTAMKDWRGAVRTWEKNERNGTFAPKGKTNGKRKANPGQVYDPTVDYGDGFGPETAAAGPSANGRAHH